MEKINYIIGIIGKKGSGKSQLAKSSLKNIDRYIVLDVLHEYNQGIIFLNFEEMIKYLKEHEFSKKFKIIYRPSDDYDSERFLEMTKYLKNFTLILEESDFHCNPHKINPNLEHNLKYGRHFRRNLIWITRRPAEINRMLSAQSDLIIVFNTTEPIDLKYLSFYQFNKNIPELKKYEYAFSGDEKLLSFFEKKS